MKKLRLVLAAIFALSITAPLAGCGVKDELEKPNAQPTKKGERNPSQPSSPL
ncbi:putative small lipoprotein YifL [Rhizomicrobium palustre]|jgi:predicted small lipoprotein YifL|uniref:Putative small lipoprotein YifL n=1 Tax=Rhizomicrobium palustre TaxID=189966 RepID=A0A846MXY9_9PROT|nr:hypothetical protein [Rhizomicrobium palustre]NIK87922.1 putative small lipoprotein YifL [Rhizomicrobium palustre]